MSAEIDFEGRVRSELRSALGRAAGPNPDWATSPAAAVVAADPVGRPRGVPWRLMAVAAVLVVGSLTAVILASPKREEAGVPGCPTLADYAAASAEPELPMGRAPGVSFPPVAPTATMTTGLLQPGDWAVIANANGPGLQMRVRDLRDCGRLPDRPSYHPGGSIRLVTVDARILRDESGLSWLGARQLIELMVGEGQGGSEVQSRGMPGSDTRTSLAAKEGFAASSTVAFDLPGTDKLVTLDHPGINTQTLPGLELTSMDQPRARWVLQDGSPTGGGFIGEPFASPGPSATTGEVRIGEDVTFETFQGLGVLRLANVDSVAAYPGLLPTPGHVFLEVLVTLRDFDGAAVALPGWRAIGEDGTDVPILRDAYGADPMPGVPYLLREEGSDAAWIVVEAPERGPVRLEYRHKGTTDGTFWLQLRD